LKAYSKEFYEAQEFFERCVARSCYRSLRFDKPKKEDRGRLPNGEWYDHGETNALFNVFLHGVEFGSRVAALENSESPATSYNTGSPKLPSETDFMLWVHSHKETPSPCAVYDYLTGQLRASA
jgi:hypothetical protein